MDSSAIASLAEKALWELQKRFSKRKVHFLFLSFLSWRKKKRKDEKKIGKGTFQKQNIKIVFWGGCEQKFFCLQRASYRKIGKHYVCLEGNRKRAFSLQPSLFGHGTFVWPYKIIKHYGFGRQRGKPKMAFWFQKYHFGQGPRMGFPICDAQKLCSAENTIF